MSSSFVTTRPSLASILRGRAIELVRFGITGTICVCLNVLVIVVLTDWLGLNYLVSTGICFAGGTVVSFWMNRRWTFERWKADGTGDFIRYVSVVTIQLALCLILCNACVQLLHVPYVVAVVVLSVVLAPVTFFLHRGFSFQMRWFG